MIRNPVFLYRVRAGALPPDTWRRTGRGAVLSATAPALLTSEIWYEVSGESGECSMAAALPFSNCASTVLKLVPYPLPRRIFPLQAIEVVVGREDGEVDNGVVRVKAESQSASRFRHSE